MFGTVGNCCSHGLVGRVDRASDPGDTPVMLAIEALSSSYTCRPISDEGARSVGVGAVGVGDGAHVRVGADLVEAQEEQVRCRPELHRDHGADARQQLTGGGRIVGIGHRGIERAVGLADRQLPGR